MGKRKAVAAPVAKERLKVSPVSARNVVLLALVALLASTLFYQGLFWPLHKMLYSTVLLASAIVAVLVAYRRQTRWTWGHVLSVTLVAAYAIGVVNPASLNGAVRGAIMWGGFVALYALVSAMRLGETERQWLLGGLVASGVALAIVGLAIYVGVYDSPHQLIGGRISAGFEYANATASWFMVCILMGLAMGFQEKRTIWRVFWSTAVAIILPAFLLTLSRGGYIALVAGVMLLVALNFKRTFAIVSFAVPAAAAGLGITYLLMQSPGWSALVVSPLLAAVVAFLAARFVVPHERVFGVASVLALTIGVVALGIGGVAGFLPEAFSTYFARITLRGIFEDARFVFIGDGLRALQESPWFGYGGGAWNAVYHQFQTYFYGTARAHSDPLDIALEIGIIGLIAYFAFVFWHIYGAWKNRRNPSVSAIFVVVGALLFHSLGEALLAFPAMYLMLFALIGALPVIDGRFCARFDVRWVLLPSMVATLVFGGAQYLAEFEMQRIPELAKAGQAGEIVVSLQRALRIVPWHSGARRELDNMMRYQPLSDVVQRSNLEALVRHEPFDPRATNLLGHWHISRGNNRLGVAYHAQNLILQPRNSQNYEALALSAAWTAINLRAQGQNEWQEYADKVFSAHRQFEAVRAAIPAHLLPLSAVPFEFSSAFALALGEAYALRGDMVSALPHLGRGERDANPQLAARAGLMLARIHEILGQSAEAQALVAKHGATEGLGNHLELVRRTLP